MSRDIGEAYARAVALATDDHNAPGRLGVAVDAAFGLDGVTPQDVWFREALIRSIGLVHCPVTLDGHGHFDVPSLYQGPPGWPAWVLPVRAWGAGDDGEPLLEDLIAWCDEGKHAGKVWTMMGYTPAIGLDSVPDGQRAVDVFVQPKLWLLNWLKLCRERFAVMGAVEPPWPDQLAALVLDPKRVRWRPDVAVYPIVPLTVDSINFRDSPALRDYVARVMRLELPPLPRLRAAKAKPESPHGPPRPEPATPALASTGGGAAS